MLHNPFLCFITASDVEKRKNPVCGFVTPLEGSEAEAHRKPEVIHIKRMKYLKNIFAIFACRQKCTMYLVWSHTALTFTLNS